MKQGPTQLGIKRSANLNNKVLVFTYPLAKVKNDPVLMKGQGEELLRYHLWETSSPHLSKEISIMAQTLQV